MIAPTSARSAFIATLGTEPQVVTVVIDRLHQDYGLRFHEAVIIHTQPRPVRDGERPDPIQASLDAVRAEMANHIRAGVVQADYYVPLRLANHAPIYDIYSAQDARAVFRAIDGEVVRVRDAGHNIHFSAAGGRKGMTMYAMAVAQFRFRPGADRLWLLGSTPAFQASRQLHAASSDDAFIIPVPIAVMDESFESRLAKAGRVYRSLDLEKQKLLSMIVIGGLGNAKIAHDIHKSVKRVEQLVLHLRLELGDRLDRVFEPRAFREELIRLYSPYFEWRQLIDPDDPDAQSQETR